MAMSTHELEAMYGNRVSPRDRLKQTVFTFLAGMSIMSFFMWDAGILDEVKITQENFEGGGEFVYKTMARDYAVSDGTHRQVSEDMLMHEKDDYSSLIYSIFLDDKSLVGSNVNRFHVGAHIIDTKTKNNKKNKDGDDDDEHHPSYKEYKSSLLLLNKDTPKAPSSEETVMTFNEFKGKGRASEGDSQLYWESIPYNVGKLPKNVPCAKTQFRFNNGFLSIMIHAYKVRPALIQYVKEYRDSVIGNDKKKKVGSSSLYPLVLVTCSIPKKICTFYSPLDSKTATHFLLGHPDTEKYSQILANKEDGNTQAAAVGDSKTNEL